MTMPWNMVYALAKDYQRDLIDAVRRSRPVHDRRSARRRHPGARVDRDVTGEHGT